MKRFLVPAAIIFALCMASAAWAANVAGTWTGTIEIRHGSSAPIPTPVQLRLEQSGNSLTGEIAHEGDEEKAQLQNGRVEGSRVYFEATSKETRGPVQFRLTLSGKRLTGEMSGEVEQGKVTGRVDLTRQTQ